MCAILVAVGRYRRPINCAALGPHRAALLISAGPTPTPEVAMTADQTVAPEAVEVEPLLWDGDDS